MDGLQRGSAAIVGVAESDLGVVAAEMSPIDLMAQGLQRALADCGLHLRDVDGLLCATTQSRTSGLALSEYLGISPAIVDTTILGGSSFMFHVAHAQAALQLGLCKVAAITDGGGAVIMTTAERARSLKKPPVYVLGCGQAITHANISSMPDLTATGALQSGRAAYEMAQLSLGDIDVVELYDAFTINTILFLEDLGF